MWKDLSGGLYLRLGKMMETDSVMQDDTRLKLDRSTSYSYLKQGLRMTEFYRRPLPLHLVPELLINALEMLQKALE